MEECARRAVGGGGRGAKSDPVVQDAKTKQKGFPRAEEKTRKSAWISAILTYVLKQAFTLRKNEKSSFENLLSRHGVLLGYFLNKAMIS